MTAPPPPGPGWAARSTGSWRVQPPRSREPAPPARLYRPSTGSFAIPEVDNPVANPPTGGWPNPFAPGWVPSPPARTRWTYPPDAPPQQAPPATQWAPEPPAAQQLFVDQPAARPVGFGQWQALTGRLVRTMITNGELIFAVITPLVFTLGFYLPLRYVMRFRGIDYAQFVMPIIVLQTMSFTMMSNAQIAAFEAMTGLNTRLRAMPVGRLVPLSARLCAGLLRSVTSLAAALVFGYVIGFRFHAGIGTAVLFCVMSLAVGTVLAIGADALGSLTKNPEALSQALTLPTLIFGMLSCGFVPESGFPAWIRPFVRNQPISQFSFALRDLSQQGVTWHVLWVPLVWLAGLALGFVPLAVWASVRRT